MTDEEWDGIGFNVAMLKNHSVRAVDLEHGRYLLGGLGSFGMGTMWFDFKESWEPGMGLAPDDPHQCDDFGRTSVDHPLRRSMDQFDFRGIRMKVWVDAWRNGELVNVRCARDLRLDAGKKVRKGRNPKHYCGTTGPFPAHQLPVAGCPHCDYHLKVTGPYEGD